MNKKKSPNYKHHNHINVIEDNSKTTIIRPFTVGIFYELIIFSKVKQ